MNYKAQFKIMLAAILFLMAFLHLSSCKEETLKKPAQIACYAMNMIREDNMEMIKEYTTEKGRRCINFFIEARNEIPVDEGLAYPGKNIHKIIHAQIVQLGDTLITDSYATIVYKYKYHRKDAWSSIQFTLIKENKKWEINCIK